MATTFQNGAPLDRIWQGGAATTEPDMCDLQVVSWNIERGRQISAVSSSLERLKPEIALLQEVDVNARRTGFQNVAEQLANRLGLNYLFAAEFEELGQGSRNLPAYQGQAILTALPASSARIIRFQNQSEFWQPRWYLPNWSIFQRRAGGRIALAAELGSGLRQLVVYSVHLESREGEDLRLRQIREVIVDAGQHSEDTPIIIAGDFNTRQRNSPIVSALLQAGFRKAVGQGVTTTHGTAIDWIFVRGPVNFTDGAIHRQVRASDHFPLSVRISLASCGGVNP